MQNRSLVTTSIIMICTVLGAIMAAIAPPLLPDPTQQRALAIIATPLGTALGLLLTRSGWRPLSWTGCGYIWSLFIAAWLERRLVGPLFGGANQHSTYFNLVIVLEVLSGLAISAMVWQRRVQPHAE
ncbi:MAG: hypothetical protein H0T53_02750 [Herpetosiphonaceae bacterium]|nr:hypothetical protein [Herpetosiphonaceae bacterium]